jgi:hypothetical protein
MATHGQPKRKNDSSLGVLSQLTLLLKAFLKDQTASEPSQPTAMLGLVKNLAPRAQKFDSLPSCILAQKFGTKSHHIKAVLHNFQQLCLMA